MSELAGWRRAVVSGRAGESGPAQSGPAQSTGAGR
jgi:hypothetical protein